MSTVVRHVPLLCALACVYVVAAKLSLLTDAFLSTDIVWILPAITLYVCLKWGLRWALAIFAAVALATWSIGIDLPQAVLMGLGAALEAVLATVLVKRFLKGPDYFLSSSDVFHFVWIACVCGFVAASLGFMQQALAGHDPIKLLAVRWFAECLGNAAGMIIFAPVLLTLPKIDADFMDRRRVLEMAFFVTLLAAVTHVAFGDLIGQLPLAFLPLPFILWAVFRFTPCSMAIATALVCVIAALHTAQGAGPFSRGHFSYPDIPLALVLTYTSLVQIMGLSSSALMYQRKKAEDILKAERDGLERQVELRTHELRRDIEAREQIERILREREIQLEEAQHLANIGSWNLDKRTGTVTWSDQLYRIYGTDKDAGIHPSEIFREFVHPHDYEAIKSKLADACERGVPFRMDHRILFPDGRAKIVATRTFPVLDASGKVERIFGTVQDVTERRLSEAKLKAAEQRYRQVVELSPDPIFIVQNYKLVLVNKAAATLARAAGVQQLEGKAVVDLFADDKDETVAGYIARIERGGDFDPLDAQLIRVDGSTVDVEIRSASFTYEGKPAEILIMRDISERKKAVEKMTRLAHYDILTGLPNRSLFHQLLAHALAVAERNERSLEVLFVDVDKFKFINDTYGHAAGDQVLRQVAARMRAVLRDADTVARLAGDEFIVLLEADRERTRGSAVARKILRELAKPIIHQDLSLVVTVSIGISRYPQDAADAEGLLDKADAAMYRAKEAGRSDYRYFAPEAELKWR
jgi:diguanylate cyclase (GGDEF)-like protein/PAS domain S-box-containing protein